MKRLLIAVAIVVVLVLAFAVPVFAAPPNDAPTYGSQVSDRAQLGERASDIEKARESVIGMNLGQHLKYLKTWNCNAPKLRIAQ